MKKYYLHENNSQKGPFSYEELKSLNISTETFVWFDGLKTWQKASEIPELKDLFISIPPPFNPMREPSLTIPPPIYTETKPLEKTKSGNLYTILITLIILGIAAYLLYINNIPAPYSSTGVSNYTEKVQSLEETEKLEPAKFLTTTGTYRPNLLGNKFKVKIIVTNNAKTATFKDPVVRVTFLSKTNSVLRTEDFTFYEIFPPGSTKAINQKFQVIENMEKLDWMVVSAGTIN